MKKITFIFPALILVILLSASVTEALKGDFQNFTPGAHYIGVIMQQGSVQLDEDFNETVHVEIFALDMGSADEVFAKRITDDPCKWLFLGYLDNSGDWEKNLFTIPRDLYPAVQSGLRLLIDINADELHPTYLEYSFLSVVPAPATFLLMGSGLLGLAGWRRFRKS